MHLDPEKPGHCSSHHVASTLNKGLAAKGFMQITVLKQVAFFFPPRGHPPAISSTGITQSLQVRIRKRQK